MNANKKYKIGLSFGAFDPSHIGHKNLFRNAKRLCDKLIVCISDAEYIKKHKNRDEFVPLKQRMEVIKKNKYVDKVDVQSSEFGKKEAVKRYKPDVLFVGNDWTPKTYTGMNLGVKVIFLPYTDGVSSTILRKNLSSK